MQFKIGSMAERTGTNAPTIRYYEEIGLLPRPRRHDGGQRGYDEEDVKRLTFIRRCREFGFPIEQVRRLVTLMHSRDRSCTEARDVAQRHLESVPYKLAELRALKRSIAAFVLSWDTTCAGGPDPDCVMLEELAASPVAAKSQCKSQSQA